MTKLVSVHQDAIVIEGYEASEVLGILIGLLRATSPDFASHTYDVVNRFNLPKQRSVYDNALYEDGVSKT